MSVMRSHARAGETTETAEEAARWWLHDASRTQPDIGVPSSLPLLPHGGAADPHAALQLRTQRSVALSLHKRRQAERDVALAAARRGAEHVSHQHASLGRGPLPSSADVFTGTSATAGAAAGRPAMHDLAVTWDIHGRPQPRQSGHLEHDIRGSDDGGAGPIDCNARAALRTVRAALERRLADDGAQAHDLITAPFAPFDPSGCGEVGRDALRAALQVLGARLGDDAFAALWAHADRVDGSRGVVAYAAFVRRMLAPRRMLSAWDAARHELGDAKARDIFARFDRRGEGKLDRSEFSAALRTLFRPHHVSEREASLLFNAFDEDKNGMLDIAEFSAFLAHGAVGDARAAAEGGHGKPLELALADRVLRSNERARQRAGARRAATSLAEKLRARVRAGGADATRNGVGQDTGDGAGQGAQAADAFAHAAAHKHANAKAKGRMLKDGAQFSLRHFLAAKPLRVPEGLGTEEIVQAVRERVIEYASVARPHWLRRHDHEFTGAGDAAVRAAREAHRRALVEARPAALVRAAFAEFATLAVRRGSLVPPERARPASAGLGFAGGAGRAEAGVEAAPDSHPRTLTRTRFTLALRHRLRLQLRFDQIDRLYRAISRRIRLKATLRMVGCGKPLFERVAAAAVRSECAQWLGLQLGEEGGKERSDASEGGQVQVRYVREAEEGGLASEVDNVIASRVRAVVFEVHACVDGARRDRGTRAGFSGSGGGGGGGDGDRAAGNLAGDESVVAWAERCINCVVDGASLRHAGSGLRLLRVGQLGQGAAESAGSARPAPACAWRAALARHGVDASGMRLLRQGALEALPGVSRELDRADFENAFGWANRRAEAGAPAAGRGGDAAAEIDPDCAEAVRVRVTLGALWMAPAPAIAGPDGATGGIAALTHLFHLLHESDASGAAPLAASKGDQGALGGGAQQGGAATAARLVNVLFQMLRQRGAPQPWPPAQTARIGGEDPASYALARGDAHFMARATAPAARPVGALAVSRLLFAAWAARLHSMRLALREAAERRERERAAEAEAIGELRRSTVEADARNDQAAACTLQHEWLESHLAPRLFAVLARARARWATVQWRLLLAGSLAAKQRQGAQSAGEGGGEGKDAGANAHAGDQKLLQHAAMTLQYAWTKRQVRTMAARAASVKARVKRLGRAAPEAQTKAKVAFQGEIRARRCLRAAMDAARGAALEIERTQLLERALTALLHACPEELEADREAQRQAGA
eukprot:g2327.t1